MVKVYFEGSGSAEAVGIFNDGNIYNACYESLEEEALKNGWEMVTESVDSIELDDIFDLSNLLEDCINEASHEGLDDSQSIIFEKLGKRLTTTI